MGGVYGALDSVEHQNDEHREAQEPTLSMCHPVVAIAAQELRL